MARRKSSGLHQIQYGTTPIPFEVVYSARKTLGIVVYPDGAVIVRSPKGVPLTQIMDIVQRRGGWILKQRRRFSALKRPVAPAREYVSGEVFRYLGDPLCLNVVESAVRRVTCSQDLLTVETPQPDDRASVAVQVEGWFEAQARRVFRERLEACFAQVAHWGRPVSALTIRTMKTRWGSMSSKGRMTLNLKLIQAPVALIDYVILHELCHLREMNHSPAYYALFDQVLPTWRAYRRQINQYEFT